MIWSQPFLRISFEISCDDRWECLCVHAWKKANQKSRTLFYCCIPNTKKRFQFFQKDLIWCAVFCCCSIAHSPILYNNNKQSKFDEISMLKTSFITLSQPTRPNRIRINRQNDREQSKAGLLYCWFAVRADYCYKIESILQVLKLLCYGANLSEKWNKKKTNSLKNAWASEPTNEWMNKINEKHGNRCRRHFKTIPNHFCQLMKGKMKKKTKKIATAVRWSGQWLDAIITCFHSGFIFYLSKLIMIVFHIIFVLPFASIFESNCFAEWKWFSRKRESLNNWLKNPT